MSPGIDGQPCVDRSASTYYSPQAYKEIRPQGTAERGRSSDQRDARAYNRAVIASRIFGRRWIAEGGAVLAVFAVAGVVFVAGGCAAPTPRANPASASVSSAAIALDPTAAATSSPLIVPGTMTVGPTAEASPVATFPPLDLFATPSPAPARGALPTDPSYTIDPRRPLPVQTVDWLELKASGRISIVGGHVTVLPETADPLVNPITGVPVPARAMLDTTWTRWIVEPPGYGTDEKGNRYSNLSYWNLCGDGAMTVALWYWQQLIGHPDVTGAAGYFLDPYASEAVGWPSPGPTIAVSGGARLGTYWSGTDRVSGFTAHGRGFVMYLAMQSQPATWQSAGLSVFARDGRPLYPTSGTPRTNIQTGLNWEVSGRDTTAWTEAYYASVIRPDPTPRPRPDRGGDARRRARRGTCRWCRRRLQPAELAGRLRHAAYAARNRDRRL